MVWVSTGLGAFGIASGQSSGPMFPDPEFRAEAFAPYVIRAADLDHDGKLDWVASGGSTTIGFGDGRGGVSGAVRHETDTSFDSLAIGDLDGNGWEDLVVSARNSQEVVTLLATGQGKFASPARVPIGAQPNAIALGDLDGDQDLDLVAASATPDGVDVLLGDGLGQLVSASRYSAGSRPIAVALGDVDGDVRLDAVIANASSADVSILLGDGTGGFAAPNSLAIGGAPSSVVVADFDMDTHLDIAVADAWNDSVVVLLGTGSGGFLPPSVCLVGLHPSELTATDFDGDGKLDLLTMNWLSASLLRGLGNGAFASAVSRDIGEYASSLACGDFDGDGTNDVVVADGGRAAVTYAFGDGHGGFAVAERIPLGLDTRALASGDFDGDGAVDVALIGTGSFAWYRGDGQGGLSSPATFGTQWATDIQAADLDGDGDTDVGVVSYSSDVVSWLNDGHGNFAQGSSINVDPLSNIVGELADVDGDGLPDWVVARSDADKISVLINDGSGAFTPSGEFAAPGYPFSPTIADFDGDGRLDIAVLRFQPSAVNVLLNDGQGGLSTPLTFAVPQNSVDVRALAAGDLDGDGVVDLVGCGLPAQSVVRWRGDGAGGFAEPAIQGGLSVPGLPIVIAVELRDLDLDGDLDLVAVAPDNFTTFNVVIIRLGDGHGRFGPPHWHRAGALAQCLELCDLDQDHRVDLVVGNGASFDLSVFLNRLPAPLRSYCTAGTSTHGCVAQLNGVGYPVVGATSGFQLVGSNLEGLRGSVIFYGVSGATELPWAIGGTSYLCVQPPGQRMAIQNTGGTANQCDGSIAQDWSAFVSANPSSLGAPFSPGTNVWAQAWYRDPPAPRTSNLSNGLVFTVVP